MQIHAPYYYACHDLLQASAAHAGKAREAEAKPAMDNYKT